MSPFTVPHFQLKENHKQCSMNDRAPQSCFALSQFVIFNIGNTVHLGMDTVCTSRRQINPFLSIVLKSIIGCSSVCEIFYTGQYKCQIQLVECKSILLTIVFCYYTGKTLPSPVHCDRLIFFQIQRFYRHDFVLIMFECCWVVFVCFFSSKVANVCLCWEE